MAGQVNFNLEQADDQVLPDGMPSFEGGQFSNVRGNLLQPNQSKQLTNCDVDKLGKLRTRRGTVQVGATTPANVAGKIVQGLTSYQTKDANYIVAAHNRHIYKLVGTAWVQIALGGVADNEDIVIYRQGTINNPPVVGTTPGGYSIGDTALVVDGLPAAPSNRVEIGEKLYFINNLRTDYYEYTIAAVTPLVGVGGTVTTITLEEPGLVFPVKDNWNFVVARPAKINNAAGYPKTALSFAIDGYIGTPFPTEKFVIKSENTTHVVAAGSTSTLLNFTGAMQDDWIAASDTVPVVFAQGNDALYFSDGVGDIYGWTGATNPAGGGGLFHVGLHSLLDDYNGTFQSSRTKPPTGVKSLLWFQNRLIASSIATEPDAIYFSDYFNASAWDQDYQKVRIGGGESDPITGILAWTDLNMLVFKKNSCYLINLDPAQNPDPTDPTLLVASFAVKQLHKLIGCPAPFSAMQVGGGSTTPGSDVFFVDGDKKVHSVRRVMAAETQQEVGQAMSLPIQDVLDVINLDTIVQCNAMYHNEHYILAYPSTRATDGGLVPSEVVTYNLLTQSWCGKWNWAATCFSRRTDMGSYSRLIFGDVNGYVRQWLDDISLDEETTPSYQDTYGGVANPIATQITTRAITFGDLYGFKTGLSVEFEFDESIAEAVTVQVILDGVVQNTDHNGLLLRGPLTDAPFSTLTDPRLRLPFRLYNPSAIPPIPHVVLPNSPGLMRKAFDLQRYGTWRELQFKISSPQDKLAIRSIRVTGFSDTVRIQTLPDSGIFGGTPGP